MNPSDFDDDSGALSFSELPPSVARQYAQQMGNFGAAGRPVMPVATPSLPTGTVSAPATNAQPVPPMTTMPARPPAAIPVPVQQYQQGREIMQIAPGQPVAPVAPPQPEAPKDNSTLMFIGAALLLSGVGYWAYSKMEKDKRKMRVGPPSGQTASFGDDDGDDSGPDEDDGEPGGALDAYEDAGLDPSDVDPHEEGGIKLVKG